MSDLRTNNNIQWAIRRLRGIRKLTPADRDVIAAVIEDWTGRLSYDKQRILDKSCQRRDRLRKVAQVIIAEIGSVGPEDGDKAAERAVSEIQRLRSILKRIERARRGDRHGR